MDHRYFPMDRQLCTLEIESFGHTMADIEYKWGKGVDSIGVASDVSLPQFKGVGHRQQSMVIRLNSGNYSRLACEMLFERSMGYYLLQIYIPAILIVLISWVSFWHSRSSSTARTILGITTVLTMTTLMSSTNAALPKVSYVKSIDIYLGFCFLMVFAALLEYATVVYLAKRIELRKSRHGSGSQNPEDPEVSIKLLNSPDKIYGLSSSDLDKYSRILFPIVFVCFQLIYWLVYLHISDVTEPDIVLWE
jgi:glycine receptor alpha-3